MITTINSRVAIQARIAERQRQYRDSDNHYGPTGLFFRRNPEAECLKLFQAA